MPLKVVIGGVEKPPTKADVTVAGAAKRVRRIEVYDDGAWRIGHSFIQPLSLSISPDTVEGVGDGTTGQTVYTSLASALPSGGQGPFTYAWTQTSGAAATILNPAGAGTQFSRFLPKFGTSTATFRCDCTDSIGQTAAASVSAYFSNGSL